MTPVASASASRARVVAPTDATLAWVVAFAVGVLIDAVHFSEPALSFYSVATIAAIGVVLDPRSRRRLLLLTGALAFATAWYLPDIWNHWVLVGVLGAALTAARLIAAVRRGWDRSPTNAELAARAAPLLRIGFLTTFGLAAFAKLNTGFLDAATSCAVWIVDRVPVLPDVPEAARGTAVALAVGLEVAIPVLLVVRRTRLLGVAVGWSFHLFTAIAGHASFAAFAWAFYALFLPPQLLADVATDVRTRWRRALGWFDAHSPRGLRIRHAWPALGVLWVALVTAADVFPIGPEGRLHRVAAAGLYTIWTVWTGAILLRAWVSSRREATASPGRAPGFWALSPMGVVAVAVIVASGLAPYLGFKTQYSFTMYSDLRTEADQWNHLVVPDRVKVGDWQDDLVEVLATSDRELDSELRLSRDGAAVLPVLELRRLSHLYPDAPVTYRYAGVTREADQLGAEPIIGDDLPWLMRKIARFRPAVAPEARTCQH